MASPEVPVDVGFVNVDTCDFFVLSNRFFSDFFQSLESRLRQESQTVRKNVPGILIRRVKRLDTRLAAFRRTFRPVPIVEAAAAVCPALITRARALLTTANA
jgi:hypothetical protein